jgi:PTS system ascorbate-specific IIA component
MSVALLLVTHEHIGNHMLSITASILNDDLKNVTCVEIPMDSDTDQIAQLITLALGNLATDDGVLILTDSYGSTPCNIAKEFLNHEHRILVSGLNLPMLIRIMNYRLLPLDELKDIAIDGGKRGITSMQSW